MNNQEEKQVTVENETPNNQAEIVKKLEGLTPEELEELKTKLQAIKKEKVKEKEAKREFTDEELSERFVTYIEHHQKELKKTWIPFIFVVALTLAFLITFIVVKNASLLYGFGFCAIFLFGVSAYMIITTKELKALKEGLKDPRANMHLVFEEKQWYQIEYENMTDEEREKAKERYRSYNPISGKYRKPKE